MTRLSISRQNQSGQTQLEGGQIRFPLHRSESAIKQPCAAFTSSSPNHFWRHANPRSTHPHVSAFTYNQPGDAFEKVDLQSDQLAIPNLPKLQRKCASCEEEEKRLRRKCANCKAEGEKNKLQREGTSSTPHVAPPIVHDVLRTPGQPLDAGTLAFMEPRFGHDFSRVRIHADARASESAQAVNALAYTVGSRIVFDSRNYAPETAKGRELLAHELTHVVEQGSASHNHASNAPLAIGPAHDEHEREADRVSLQVTADTQPAERSRPAVIRGIELRLQRQPVPGNIELVSGAYVGDIAGAGDNLREDVLTVMDRLFIVGAMTAADYGAERPAVLALPAKSVVPKATIPKTINSVKAAQDPTLSVLAGITAFGMPITAELGAGKTNLRADVLLLQDKLLAYSAMSAADHAAEHASVTATAVVNIPDAMIPKTIQGIAKVKRAFVAGEIRRDLLAGTRAVNPTQHAEVEHILNPATILVPAAPPVGGAPPPPPVVAPPPPLTGAGAGGAFEHDMLDYLKRNIGGWAKEFNKLKAKPGQPSFPIASANNIAKAAQGEVEHYFGPYIKTAGRGGGDIYHPGVYSLTAKLGDESTRPINDATRRGWLGYFETLRAPNCFNAPCAQEVLDAHHFFGARDSAELDRITNVYLSSPVNVNDINDTIHSWPAEAGTGTVFIQPYQAATTPKQLRENRWDLFTTLIHEMMHIVTHPNYAAAADRIGGTGRKILIEGFAEVMRKELWSGPGNLSGRIGNPEKAPLRQQVEGAVLPYDASAVIDHGYYDQLADAQQIDAKVGHQNAKAAFFLGQVELLGLGAGTSTESGGAIPAGIAGYTATDSKDAEIVVAQPGDTFATIRDRTGADPLGLIDEATGIPLVPISPIPAGKRIKVPGIRWIAAVKNNTLGTVAEQNHVSVAALAVANGLPANSPATTPLIPPKRILIPVHRNLP